jgi:threonine aldolase
LTPIDLRSDTVTRPSPAMRRAMVEAEVGDDVLDGDPTTRRLEQRVATLLGKEDALFFPSGTQANQTAIQLATRPGTELLVEAGAHLVHYEQGGLAALSGVQPRLVATPDGILTAQAMRAALRPSSPHLPRISAIAVENTHNASGGRVMTPAVMTEIVALAREVGLPIHLDGARLWNAAAALDVEPARLAAGADTVMVSFSKGLGCPVGSCLAFTRSARPRVWEIRKRLGGGMRQSGMLAAAALYALDHHLPRIADDHANAARLAQLAGETRRLRSSTPESNIVLLDLIDEAMTADDAVAKLVGAGVLVVPFGPKRMRAVTHLDVTREDVERAAAVIRKLFG